jgi:hypothetical protein
VNITKVSFSRKFNIGNYESLDASMEAELSEKDNPHEVLTILKDNVEMWFIDQRKTGANHPAQTQIAPAPTTTPPATLGNIRRLFPEDLEKLLTFEQKGKVVIIKPRAFLGTTIYSEILDIVRKAGGEYISAGKDSHFRVPMQ